MCETKQFLSNSVLSLSHVYLIRMGYFPENEIFTVIIMSKMTHILNKIKNNCFQILLQTVLSVKQMIRNCIIFHWYFCETLYKTSDCTGIVNILISQLY